MTTSLRTRRFRSGARAAALACALLAAAAQPAGAAPYDDGDDKGKDVQGVTGPAMKIAIDNARKTSGPGQEATYTIRVSSLQDGPIEGLVVRQTLPDGMDLVEPGPGGKVRGGREVTWTADLKGHKHAKFTARTRIADGAPTAGELAATACAYEKGTEAAVVCAPDIDKLTDAPAAARDDGRGGDRDAEPRAAAESDSAVAYGLGAGALLLGGGGLVFALRRRAAAARRG
ncbi:hypothetical protein DMB38_23620 [Streptomyces sp. WAC 06738]|uniref:hypothetical protein n=1 Tax=Streptomyces sp. WAC 06738 TaxID=2203210 RepID=UPI000F6FA9FD|nr:hypothetical protein [Streptomyces sp. WAC 06738]AZM48375.1 hypothetical protein DMB38_23620 [Streptomyces sp. WAC 06738]